MKVKWNSARAYISIKNIVGMSNPVAVTSFYTSSSHLLLTSNLEDMNAGYTLKITIKTCFWGNVRLDN